HSNVASPVAPDRRDWDTRPGGKAVGRRSSARTGKKRAGGARAGIGGGKASHSATREKKPSVAGRCSSRLHERGEIDATKSAHRSGRGSGEQTFCHAGSYDTQLCFA